jgi:transposase
VDLSEESRTVEIHVEHVGVLNCPVCDAVCGLYDHSAERRWRDLDTMGFTTFVVARIPRSNCKDHGVKQLEVPWASPNSHMTHGLEDWTIRVLELTKSQVRTARLLRLSAQQVHDVMHRAVNRGLARRKLIDISHVSVDEKGFQRGRKFATVVCDTGAKRVLEVELGRDEKTAIKAFSSIPEPEKVKTVSLDMAECFRNAAMTQFPNADIVHDRFHIAAMLGEAVDDTRRAEVKKHPELKESRFIWLKNPENLTEKQKGSFDALVKTELKTAEAYAFKQTFKAFFEQEDIPAGIEFFENWTSELDKHDLPKMHKVARTLEKNIQGLLNYLKWRITNAYGEAVNALIQEIKTVARGFRQFENFRIAILFFLGKLELHPRKTS